MVGQLEERLYIGGAREAELAPPQTHVRCRGRVLAHMDSEVDDAGGTGGELTRQRRPRGRREEDDDDACQLLDRLTSAKATGGRGARARRRPGRGQCQQSAHCMPKLVITACTGAHSGTRPAKQCLGACPSWGGCNCGGSLVKRASVER